MKSPRHQLERTISLLRLTEAVFFGGARSTLERSGGLLQEYASQFRSSNYSSSMILITILRGGQRIRCPQAILTFE